MFSNILILSCLLFAITVSEKYSSKVEVIRMENSPRFYHPKAMHWDDCTQSVYFVDLLDPTAAVIGRYDWSKNKFYVATVPGVPDAAFLIPLKCSGGSRCPNRRKMNGKRQCCCSAQTKQFAFGGGVSVYIITWDGTSSTATVNRTVFELPQPSNPLNDGVADMKGRLYAGQISPSLCNLAFAPNGTFFTYSKKKGLKTIWDEVNDSNSIKWNKANTKLYYMSSCLFAVTEFDYDCRTGNVWNPRVVFNITQYAKGNPEGTIGMTIDRKGYLWLTLFAGWELWKVNPRTGKRLQVIRFPTQNLVDVEFVGPRKDVCMVTTNNRPIAFYDSLFAQGQQDTANGGYFYIVKGVKACGYSPYKACL